jgi:hypothetical protein
VERPRLTQIASPPPTPSDFAPTHPPTGFLPTSPDLLLPSTPDLPHPAASPAAATASATAGSARQPTHSARVRADAVGVVLPPAANPATGRDDSHRLSGYGDLGPANGASTSSKAGAKPILTGKADTRTDAPTDPSGDGSGEPPRPPWLSAAVAAAVLGLLLLLGWWAVGHG